jgi:hypothetical protein
VPDEEAVDEAAYGAPVPDTLDDTKLNDETVVLDCTSDVADEGGLDDPADKEEPMIPENVGEALKLPTLEEEFPVAREDEAEFDGPVEGKFADDEPRTAAVDIV